jgi:hypothetical protein
MGLWDRFYLYRNPGLELRGRAWAAADAWKRESLRAGANWTEMLDETELHVVEAGAASRPPA